MAFTVTPWEVSGAIDYDKLVEQFGVSRIGPGLLKRIEAHAAKKGLPLHHMLRRNIFFAHRDLKWILDEYEKGNRFFLYTGRGPSGSTHIGHLIPWLFTKWLQDVFDVELYFQLTDDEKFLFNPKLELEDTQRLAMENALDVIAVGFKQGKTHIFSNTGYAKTLYPQACRVAKKLTFSTAKAVFGFGNDSNVGQIFFTSMQAVPAFLPSVQAGRNIPCLIPHAIDQDPHFRVTRDIMPRMGYYKPASVQCRFLPGLTEDGKMSASKADTAIYTTDDARTVRKKVLKHAFSGGQPTVEEHRAKGGDPDIDVSYQWLTFLEENDAKLTQVYHDYKSGRLLSGELKLMLVEKLNGLLTGHQKRREQARKRLDDFWVKD
ncbi:tryptophan--tRNA ligase [Candidatus Woesearchaeota archaeon CG_4_10_14_0_2_um_filter_57_5]|nr:MAG: tryptophan--tRNA ligase [Candidatus Woesearchaeota archaeon CG1_02_57_44]PIN70870.1 MAG: tryptophan--tRNA ligase [Candidatus Woesearchaeota archaeon CG11_big_fil_rev_8_21_14_0_20_57_5]PIZ54076.1 MAG: tryptophan--tRNA ligase [Candidatus Woesearchaeota archaeon CG_4_10_14_0_2_um_filter_57_5]